MKLVKIHYRCLDKEFNEVRWSRWCWVKDDVFLPGYSR